jgi:hypothetical protein
LVTYRISVSALAEITGQSRLVVDKKVYFSFSWNFLQEAGQGVPTVLAITSDHAFASILMDKLAAEYLMTSAPQINVPIGGGREYMSTDLKHSVFQRPTSSSKWVEVRRRRVY